MDNAGKLLCESQGFGLKLRIYDDLNAVKPLWLNFERDALLTPFQTTSWLYQWYAHIGRLDKVKPLVVVASDAWGILFILPFQIETGVLRKLSWLGNDLNDFNGPILANDYAARAPGFSMRDVWRQLLKMVKAQENLQLDYVRLENMPQLICGLANPMMALGVSLAASNAYRTPMLGGWEAFYNSKRDGKNRYKDRASRKKLEAIGEVALICPEDSTGIRDVIDTLVKQKSARFRQKGISNFLSKPGHVDFFRAIAEEERELVFVSQLNVGQIAASTGLGLTFRGSYYYILNSFALGETDRFGSGKMHMRALMKLFCEKGFDAFDFSVGDEPYKLEWCEGKHPIYYHLDASTMQGRAALAYLSAFQSTKRYIKQTPLLWNAYRNLRGALAQAKAG